MNLWLRLIWMLITARFKAKVEPMGVSVLSFRAWPLDLDFNVHLTSSRYFALADLARLDWVLRSGAWRVMWKHRSRPILSGATARYRKEIKPWQRVEIWTRPLGWDAESGYYEHRFMRDGRVLAVVVAHALFHGPNGSVDPAVIAKALGADPVSPPLPTWLAQWATSSDGKAQAIRDEEADSRSLH